MRNLDGELGKCYSSGTDVYVAGWVNTGNQSACYWKNGTRTDLYTSNDSSASAVFAAI